MDTRDFLAAEEIRVVFRRHGKVESVSNFSGLAYLLGDDRRKMDVISRQQLPIKNGQLNLLRMPVVFFAGRSSVARSRATEFIKKHPDFQGAVLVDPGSGSLDIDSGLVIFTSAACLNRGVRFKGIAPSKPPAGYKGWQKKQMQGGFNCASSFPYFRLLREDGTWTGWVFYKNTRDEFPPGWRRLPEI